MVLPLTVVKRNIPRDVQYSPLLEVIEELEALFTIQPQGSLRRREQAVSASTSVDCMSLFRESQALACSLAVSPHEEYINPIPFDTSSSKYRGIIDRFQVTTFDHGPHSVLLYNFGPQYMCPLPFDLTDGYCYLLLFPPGAWNYLADKYGPYPSVLAISEESDIFCPVVRAKVVEVSGGYHILPTTKEDQWHFITPSRVVSLMDRSKLIGGVKIVKNKTASNVFAIFFWLFTLLALGLGFFLQNPDLEVEFTAIQTVLVLKPFLHLFRFVRFFIGTVLRRSFVFLLILINFLTSFLVNEELLNFLEDSTLGLNLSPFGLLWTVWFDPISILDFAVDELLKEKLTTFLVSLYFSVVLLISRLCVFSIFVMLLLIFPMTLSVLQFWSKLLYYIFLSLTLLNVYTFLFLEFGFNIPGLNLLPIRKFIVLNFFSFFGTSPSFLSYYTNAMDLQSSSLEEYLEKHDYPLLFLFSPFYRLSGLTDTSIFFIFLTSLSFLLVFDFLMIKILKFGVDLFNLISRTLALMFFGFGVIFLVPDTAFLFFLILVKFIVNNILVLGLEPFRLTLIYLWLLWHRFSSKDPLKVHHRSRPFMFFSEKPVQVLRDKVVSLVTYLDAWRLPEGIRAVYHDPTLESLREAYLLLSQAGWPVDPAFKLSPVTDRTSRPFSSFVTGLSTFVVPLKQLKGAIAHEMFNFGFPEIPGFIHTATYTSVLAEIKSMSRYFGRPSDIPDFEPGLLEDVWSLVKAQFEYSFLTPPSEIIKSWVKKYNLGFGFTRYTRTGKPRQMKRRDAIARVGGLQPFIDLWERSLEFVGTINSIAPVFTKFETLKLSKFLSESVRTVVGSALPHHIFTTIWNHGPNHNYKVWDVPMKVGMPITGIAFGQLWSSLAKRKYCFAGDMTLFDSSLHPKIIRLCAEIRKKGYEWHPDYSKICTLIDVAYEQLITQPLGLRSTGEIYKKNKGLSTGHSSTSPDNSLAIVVAYLFAWRKLTGLRAVDFVQHNTLANFGDDHLLGYDDVPNWNPDTIIPCLKEIDIIMRNEHPEAPDVGIMGKSFLAKFPLKDPSEELFVRSLGVEPPEYLTVHNKSRLLGKIKGQVLERDPYKRRTRLISYLYLCAHHRDVFIALSRAINTLTVKHSVRWRQAGLKILPVPSYNEIVYKWYTSKKDVVSIDHLVEVTDAESELTSDDVFMYLGPSLFDGINYIISNFPTILSPKFANLSFVTLVHNHFAHVFSWPVKFLLETNPEILTLTGLEANISRTPYSFLSAAPLYNAPQTIFNYGDLLVRHWIFMFVKLFIIGRYVPFSFWDFVERFDVAIGNLFFAVFGRITMSAVTLNLHTYENLLVFFLGLVPPFMPNTKPFIFRPISLGASLSVLIGYLWNLIQPAGRTNFDPLIQRLYFPLTKSFCVKAPTGVGKSTRLIAKIATDLQRKVIVIEPRHVLVLGLTTYMPKVFQGLSFGAGTEGGVVPNNWDVIYCTFQSFLQHSSIWGTKNPIVVLDEAHIEEPIYLLAINYFKAVNWPIVLMTATPRAGLEVLELHSTTNFFVTNKELYAHDLPEYYNKVLEYLTLASFERALIFIPSIETGKRFAAGLRHSFGFINSKENTSAGKRIIICTKSVDAGLTVPDVDLVISSNVDVSIRTEISPKFNSTLGFDLTKVNKRPVYHYIDDRTVAQRKGRTGRTSHGLFLLFKLPGYEQLEEPTPLDFLSNLSLPIPLERVTAFLPTQVRDFVLYCSNHCDSLSSELGFPFKIDYLLHLNFGTDIESFNFRRQELDERSLGLTEEDRFALNACRTLQLPSFDDFYHLRESNIVTSQEPWASGNMIFLRKLKETKYSI